MSRRDKRAAPKPVMNVTPLVDVVLVLLIIFMIVIPAMGDELKIEMPGVMNADESKEPKTPPYLLAIKPDGTLFLDNDALPKVNVEGILRAANRRAPGKALVIVGDQRVRYGNVRPLMKVCQNLGFPGVSLRVNETAADELGK